jgi:ankyrin repeat protein/adenylate kinase family enzyme
LAAGFLNPPDIDDLDPEGSFIRELTGSRKTVKDFFKHFVAQEAKFNKKFEREVVLGLCHNDLHGGNLLLDSQGLVWLIDFATVKDDVHVLMDLTKFMASCLFLYLKENVAESYMYMFAKLLATTPDATTALPLVGGDELKKDVTATFVLELLSRIRHCMCIYEIGDDAPTNDGVPFALALFSWSVRMLAYNEPSMYQKKRALYFALVGAHRVLWEAGVDIGSTASAWVDQFRMVWEGQKGRRLSTSATQVQSVTFQFKVEFPRYLAQVGTAEAWSTDFLTREKVHVTEHCIAVNVNKTARIFPRYIAPTPELKVMFGKLKRIHETYLPEVLQLERYQGRLLIVGDSGAGKTMLTKQLFSELAQDQLKHLYSEDGGGAVQKSVQTNCSIIPLRVPLIDLARHLEVEPDAVLTADPVNDLLTGWVQRKYGQDSVPYKLISDVRHACLGTTERRRNSVNSADLGIDGDAPSASVADDATGSAGIDSAQIYDVAEISGLQILLDGLDEASAFKYEILEFVGSLLTTEPTHICVITSRPGSTDSRVCEALTQLGFNSFMMDKLGPAQATDITSRTLQRIQDPEDIVEAVCRDILDPGYKTLIENPLILTLLIHVLRKARQQMKAKQGDGTTADTLAEEQMKQEVMKKTEVYQRAVKLILHQSDAAKFILRDGRRDQAMVRRLEMLKSVRARKLFQTISFHNHCDKERSFTWSNVRKVCPDEEMVTVMQEAFEQGRMPIFEAVEMLDNTESMLQMTHLSFQELMAGEYTSAIVRHSHSNSATRAYMNFFLSNSSKTLDRERLSEQWWLQVWFHICEMLQPAVFEEWCSILAEDERAKLVNGRLCYRRELFFAPYQYLNVTESKAWEGGGIILQAYDVDLEEQTCKLWYVPATCVLRVCYGGRNKKMANWRFNTGEVTMYATGVAAVFRHAVALPYIQVIDSFMKRSVHFRVMDEMGFCPWLIAAIDNKNTVSELLDDYKADVSHDRQKSVTLSFPADNRCFHYKESRESFRMFPAHLALSHAKPFGVLEQARAGTLDLKPEVDPNFSDPNNGMTPLMYAAGGGHVQLVSDLLRRGASVNVETDDGATALNFAVECARGNAALECMELLIDAKSDVNRKAGKNYNIRWLNEYWGMGRPLGMSPCWLGENDKLKVLIKHGFNVNAIGDYGQTCLHVAALAADAEILSTLVDAKADISKFYHHRPQDYPRMPEGFPRFDHFRGHPGQTLAIDNVMYNTSAPFFRKIQELHPDWDILEEGVQMNASLTLPCWMYSILFDWNIYESDDVSFLMIAVEAKLDINKPLDIPTQYYPSDLFAQCCTSGAAIKVMLDMKSDMTRKGGPFKSNGTSLDLARSKTFYNQKFLDTYDDWLQMQIDEGTALHM